MNYFWESIGSWFATAGVFLKTMNFSDVFDILLIAVLLFVSIRFINERRGGKMVIGLLPVAIIYFVSVALHFNGTVFIFRCVLDIGLIAVVVIFQPEIRVALEQIGNLPFRLIDWAIESKTTNRLTGDIQVLCDAVQDMSRTHTGALIVLERSTKLGDIMETGVMIDALLSVKLLRNIFFNMAPLHDGAVIIRHMRIAAAGCVLPNATRTAEIVQNVGTRHRAAIGVSEISDAVVIVVSEETGTISLAVKGKLRRDYNLRNLRQDLLKYLGQKDTDDAIVAEHDERKGK